MINNIVFSSILTMYIQKHEINNKILLKVKEVLL